MHPCICHSEICRLAGFLLAHHPAFFCSALHTESQLVEHHPTCGGFHGSTAQSSPPTSTSGEIWRHGTKAWRQSSCSKEGQCSTFQNIHKAHFSPMALHVGHSAHSSSKPCVLRRTTLQSAGQVSDPSYSQHSGREMATVVCVGERWR